jgi:hypothetical protein
MVYDVEESCILNIFTKEFQGMLSIRCQRDNMMSRFFTLCDKFPISQWSLRGVLDDNARIITDRTESGGFAAIASLYKRYKIEVYYSILGI